MSFIEVTCPACSRAVHLGAGMSQTCPYCGNDLSGAGGGAAFAVQPEPMQYAEAPQPAQMQFAQPPAMPAQMPQPAAMPAPMPQQYGMQAPQYSPAMLAQAHSRRKNWYVMNSSLIGAQSIMLALGILFAAMGSRIGVPLILLWVLTLPGFGAISGLTRPDEAYIDRKPYWKSKFVQGITQFWMGAAISGAVGGILFAIIAGLLGMY